MTTGRPEIESLNQVADTTAAGLVQVGAHQAFQLYQDREFRRLVNFDRLSQAEQDRIFNELEGGKVTPLTRARVALKRVIHHKRNRKKK